MYQLRVDNIFFVNVLAWEGVFVRLYEMRVCTYV